MIKCLTCKSPNVFEIRYLGSGLQVVLSFPLQQLAPRINMSKCLKLNTLPKV